MSRSNPKILRVAHFVVDALEQRIQLAASLSLSGTQTITAGSLVNASDDLTALVGDVENELQTMDHPMRSFPPI